MTDNTENFIRELERTVAQRVEAAGRYLQSEMRKNISIPSRTVKTAATRSGGTKKVLGPRGSNRSKGGEFPHKDYGRLRASIAVEMQADAPNGPRVLVGTNLAYGKHLEFGTKSMKPRSFLRRTLKEERETIRQMITFGGRTDISVE